MALITTIDIHSSLAGQTHVVFPVTGFPNRKYVAVLATFLAPVKLSVFL